MAWSEYRTFWRQFREQYRTTGAVLPSGRRLAEALARYVTPCGRPLQILEVGPGTGPATAAIVQRMGPHDRLDLVELNDDFVRVLRQRIADEPLFRTAADRIRILHQPVQACEDESRYDIIVSGLPLNNFSVAEIEDIFRTLARLTTREGTLSFFEYISIRAAKVLISNGSERKRLRNVGNLLGQILGECEFHREKVLSNVPPAWVHHIRLANSPRFGAHIRDIKN